MCTRHLLVWQTPVLHSRVVWVCTSLTFW